MIFSYFWVPKLIVMIQGIREFPSSAVTVLCAHEDQRACLNCLHQIVVAALGQGALEQFVCPLCPEQMTRDNVKTYCQDHSDLFDRYALIVPNFRSSCVVRQNQTDAITKLSIVTTHFNS